ncbi:hypothetical protein BDF21DRAFT_493661 [Thamnidium elegans]|nr:hypothetical protein BDF21DRAFT_493661 [Thamnidium elegans]
MTAKLKNEINNNSHSLSDTTRKVFLSTYSIVTSPSGLFSPTIITAKGLYPPSIVLLKTRASTMPKRSHSVPIKLITMPPKPPQLQTPPDDPIPTSISPIIKKSKSTPPPLPAPTCSTITKLKKPTLIDTLITTSSTITTSNSSSTISSPKKIAKSNSTSTTFTTIRKAPRPSTSTRTASAAPVQIKTSNSIKLIHKKKKSPPPTPPDNKEEEEDIPLTKPISLTEKRKRQAKRADQVKIWKVREEREAREARSIVRKKLMSGVSLKKSVSTTNICITKKKKKRVKFDFDKNKVIQLPLLENEDDNNLK